MYSQSSMDHIVSDLIACWQRTLIFAVLTAIGLMIWVTCLIYSELEASSRNRAIPEAAGSTLDTSPNTVSLLQDKHLIPFFRSTSELRLTETFVDEKPRAAVIDGNRCVEGTQIQMGDKTFRVTNIRRSSVELLRNSALIVLRCLAVAKNELMSGI